MKGATKQPIRKNVWNRLTLSLYNKVLSDCGIVILSVILSIQWPKQSCSSPLQHNAQKQKFEIQVPKHKIGELFTMKDL